jgi:hypothetical protein
MRRARTDQRHQEQRARVKRRWLAVCSKCKEAYPCGFLPNSPEPPFQR